METTGTFGSRIGRLARASATLIFALSINREWYAPATTSGIARFAPRALASSTALAIFSLSPEMTTWPGQLMLAMSTSASRQTSASAASSIFEDGRHAAVGRVAGFLHEPTAQLHHAQAVIEAHRFGGGQRREFAERQAGGGVKSKIRDLRFQSFEAGETGEKDPGLRVVGLGQNVFGPFKTNLLDVAAENCVGAGEQLTAHVVFLAEVAPHADAWLPCPAKRRAVFIIATR